MTTLDPQIRGDEFRYSFTLNDGWTAAMFTGGIKFTLRSKLPASSEVNDARAIYQASVARGEITFSDDTSGTILIPGARTTLWPAQRLYWDLQGVITIGSRVLTIDSGDIEIRADVTRSR